MIGQHTRQEGSEEQMITVPQRRRRFALNLAQCTAILLICFGFNECATAGPTPEEYASHVGAGAQIVNSGDLRLDGRKAQCGQRPTVLDSQLDDYGAAYPGFLILNPKLMSKVSTPVKMWIFAHECGHQFRGPDEETADCFAVQRGRRQGWLTADGLDEVCKFISPAKGDSMHFSGSQRCEQMRKCYDDKAIQ